MALAFLSKLSSRYLVPTLRTPIGASTLKNGYKVYEWGSKFRKQIPRITVFRGVPQTHPFFDLAKQGVVLPRNIFGTVDIDMHNYGTSNSALTSWTRDKAVAETHVGEEGVLLEASIPGNRIMWSPDVWYEQEVLVRGLVCGATITPVKHTGRKSTLNSPPPQL